MYYRKFLSFTLVFLLGSLQIMAQKMNDYKSNWKKTESLEQKGLIASALKEVKTIFNLALAEANEDQQIKAAMYQMKYRNMVEENNEQSNILYLDTLIAKAKAPARNILLSMQAQLYHQYLQQNRYRLYSRTALTEEKSDDIDTWSSNKLVITIADKYSASLADKKILQSSSTNKYPAVIQAGKNTGHLRPTLYDVLAHRALEFYMNDENYISKPAYRFEIDNEVSFAPVSTFVSAPFKSNDQQSLQYQAILLLQELLRFHINDNDPSALLDADLIRLSYVNQHAVLSNKENLYLDALKNIQQQYAKYPQAAQPLYLQAVIHQEKGNTYQPFIKKETQFEIRVAKELCEEAIKSYPGTEGAINANNLLSTILQPSLNLSTEKVNIPNQPFRTLVKYKNIPTLYVRVIKSNREEIRDLTNYEESNWRTLVSLHAVKSWSVSLPNQQDYQEHATEIKIEGLPIGSYIILASIDPGFSLTKNIIARQIVHISNISYIQNNHSELFVLHRDNGQPLEKATVQLWQQNYNYNSRKYEQVKKGSYTTDANGRIKLVKDKQYYNFYLQVKYGGDELFTDDNYYNQNYDGYHSPSIKRSILFTDRSIYRPGQTLHFKGIVIHTDSATGRSSIVPGYSTEIQLFDVNGQQSAQLKVTSNEYGSYAGSFRLPEGALNGQFYLKDASNESVQYFSVEEYKRPRFYAEIKKPAGTYKLNDSVTVTGTAKAYAGNNIDGAKVTYRVVRKVIYPVWWGWGSYYRSKSIYPSGSEEMEITHGETVTGANGSFSISFKAIPDESVDKKGQPVFHYEVSADITDINGETRSGQTSVAVAYQMLKLNIDAASVMPADSIGKIRINSTNLNDLFEKANVQVFIQQLQQPNRMFRERFWEQPDEFVMSKEEFYTNFPHDPYADEHQPSNWLPGNTIATLNDSTRENGDIQMPATKATAGWIKITAITKDKYGEEVKAEKIIRLTDAADGAGQEPLIIVKSKDQFMPGEKITYRIYTAFSKINLIHQLHKTQNNIVTTYPTPGLQQPYYNEINVTDADRGGVNLSYVFVQHNRVYSGHESFGVPWTNKAIDISFESFRDKILPGSEEKWTIKIKGKETEKVAAEALISMYDASLDQFKPHAWTSLQSLWPVLMEMSSWTKNSFTAVNSTEYIRIINELKNLQDKVYPSFNQNGWLSGLEYMLQGRASGVIAFANAAPAAEQRLDEVVVTGMGHGKKVKSGYRAANKESGGFDGDADGIADSISSTPNVSPNNGNVQVRKNFNETAFFFPALYTGADGSISFSFTIPEALTQWKLMTMAHSRELASGYAEKLVVTQKPLMVQPNTPRFLRNGDRIELSAKVVNLENKEMTGTLQLELFDATTGKAIDGWMKNIFPVQYFTVAPGQSSALKFPVEVPYTFNSVLGYRYKAISKDQSFSDGEEAALPVLSNRLLVTESMPLNMRKTNDKTFKFDKLLKSSNSETLTHQSLTVEYTSNPAWYAVQALPYLAEFPYECAEQNFNRYYANVLASFISNSHPKINAVFEKWKLKDTAALLSNLLKSQELKSVLLQETPWVLNGNNESQQKQHIALLFDMVRLSKEKKATLEKLKEMQGSNGGFTWFKGGPDDRYITQYIITGIGHLRKLQAISQEDYAELKPIADKAIPYLDARIKEEYDELKKYKANLKNNQLSYTAIQYLYMRSFFAEYPVAKNAQKAYTYYKGQAKKFWLKNSRYMQGMIALALYRDGDTKTANAITASLKETSLNQEEMGMYWKEWTNGGYWWHQAPIESQALMIEVFADIVKDNSLVDDLKTWLLKQKQTQDWKTTKATAEACYALLLNGSNWLSEEKEVSIQLGNMIIESKEKGTEAGTGYFKEAIPADKVQQGMGNIHVQVKPAGNNNNATSWGAVYWQYFEDMDKVTAAATPLSLQKKLFLEKNTDRGPVLEEIKEGSELKPGDKVKVRIELRADRDMEYIHMKDMRAACMEPVNVLSGYKYQGGLGYYESTKDASTNFFFSWLRKGTYVFEYPLFVTHSGQFNNGITTIQCMYAPAFSSHSNGMLVNVGE